MASGSTVIFPVTTVSVHLLLTLHLLHRLYRLKHRYLLPPTSHVRVPAIISDSLLTLSWLAATLCLMFARFQFDPPRDPSSAGLPNPLVTAPESNDSDRKPSVSTTVALEVLSTITVYTTKLSLLATMAETFMAMRTLPRRCFLATAALIWVITMVALVLAVINGLMEGSLYIGLDIAIGTMDAASTGIVWVAGCVVIYALGLERVVGVVGVMVGMLGIAAGGATTGYFRAMTAMERDSAVWAIIEVDLGMLVMGIIGWKEVAMWRAWRMGVDVGTRRRDTWGGMGMEGVVGVVKMEKCRREREEREKRDRAERNREWLGEGVLVVDEVKVVVEERVRGINEWDAESDGGEWGEVYYGPKR